LFILILQGWLLFPLPEFQGLHGQEQPEDRKGNMEQKELWNQFSLEVSVPNIQIRDMHENLIPGATRVLPENPFPDDCHDEKPQHAGKGKNATDDLVSAKAAKEKPHGNKGRPGRAKTYEKTN
jgi:hypothetical protein